MNNENGVILPLTLIVISIITLLFFSQVSLYLVEKNYTLERYELEHLENLKQMATVDIVEFIRMMNDDELRIHSFLHYPIGTVEYEIAPTVEENVLQVKMRCMTNKGRKHIATLFYSTEYHLIIAYYEA